MLIPEDIKSYLISQLKNIFEIYSLSVGELKLLKNKLKSIDIPEEIFSEFFNYLLSIEEYQSIFLNQNTKNLKNKQKECLYFLLKGNVNEDYIKNRIKIFKKHKNKEIDIFNFIGAYSKLLADIFKYLIKEKKQEVLPSLLKLAFLDISIAAQLYIREEKEALNKLNEQYISLFNEINDGIIVINADTYKIVDINKKIEEWLGIEKYKIIDKDISILFLEETKIRKILKEKFQRYPVLYLRTKTGSLLPVELSLSFSLNNGQLFAFAIVRNIKYRLKIEKQIERLSRLYKVLSETNQLITNVKSLDELFSKIVNILVDIGQFDCAMIVPVNKQFSSFYLSCNKKIDRNKFLKEHLLFIKESIENKKIIRKVKEYGELIIIPIWKKTSTVADKELCKAVLIISSSEVSFFKEEELQLLKEVSNDLSFAIYSLEKNKKIQFLEYYDVITKLPNRRYFFNTLDSLIKREKNKKFALVVLDIISFKEINESLSFLAGDMILKSLSKKLQDYFKNSRLVARIGGDEFGIIIENGKKEKIFSYIKKILTKIKQEPFRIEDQSIFISLNAGVSFFPEDGNSTEELIAAAEAALKEAKKIGKNVCEFYNPLLKKEHLEELELENDLKNAILNEEFKLFYQPIYSLKENRIIGAEALIRWFSPKRGYVSPLHFIKILEDNGLIYDVGLFVIDTVLKQIKEWEYYGIYISINVSPYQIKKGNLAHILKEKIQKYHVNPSSVVIELTETVIMENLEQAYGELKKLKDLGCKIAIDDFGTGYSSLSYLKNLPFSSVKIDRSFIKDIPKNKNDIKISKAIINLAHSLDKTVIAEGIETQEQLEILKNLDCDYAQGYLFSKPIPKEDFEKLLK